MTPHKSPWTETAAEFRKIRKKAISQIRTIRKAAKKTAIAVIALGVALLNWLPDILESAS